MTDECKWAYRDFLNTQIDLIDKGDLKYCYDQTIEKGSSHPGDNFLQLIKSKDSKYTYSFRSIHTDWFDMAKKSCKF